MTALTPRTLHRLSLLAILACSVSPRVVHAQAAARPEFVQQILFVAPFKTTGDRRLGLRVADEMRGALRRTGDRRQLAVVGSDSAERMLKAGGFPRAEEARELDVVWVARLSRADEVLVGEVRPAGDTLEVRATLVLVRDPRVREPLPPVRGAGAEQAANALARMVVRARAQSDDVRRCENLARASSVGPAIRAAERAIAAFPTSLLARNCLVRILATQPGLQDSVLRVAAYIIARDSLNIIAHTMRARALVGANAVTAWQRVVYLKPDSVELGLEAVETFLRLGRPETALQALDTLVVHNPREGFYQRQRFRALHTLTRWDEATALGDSLERHDPFFGADPNFAVRYVETLKMHGDTVRAIAKSARSVIEHPTDGRLYVQYVDLIAGESTVALTRGLARFPSFAPLRVLAAQQARAGGDRAAERVALEGAVAADSSLAPIYLRLADMWYQEGRADSALAILTRAPRSGEGVTRLRAYLVARGLDQLRASVDSLPESYLRPMAFLALADSVESREDSRGLVVAASLQLARAHLVTGATARRCEPIQQAVSGLALATTFLARGVGEGEAATELVEARDGLQSAVDEAGRILCTEPPAQRP